MLKVFDFDISTSWILMLRCLTVGNHLSQLIMKLGWTSFTYVTLFSPTDRIRAPFNLFCFSFTLVDAVQQKSSRLHAVSKAKKNNTLVSGNAGDEKNIHPDGRNFFQIFLPEIFSFLHLFLLLFLILVFCYCFLFFELKNVYSDIQLFQLTFLYGKLLFV